MGTIFWNQILGSFLTLIKEASLFRRGGGLSFKGSYEKALSANAIVPGRTAPKKESCYEKITRNEND